MHGCSSGASQYSYAGRHVPMKVLTVKTILKSFVLYLSFVAPVSAETWISLGDTMGSEMDTSSITRNDGVTYLRMRHKIRKEQGILTMDLHLAVFCNQSLYYIQSSQISSDWSSRIVPMPDLPDKDRTFSLPTPNPAFNNMYDFVCQ